jgi:hypothetical protein
MNTVLKGVIYYFGILLFTIMGGYLGIVITKNNYNGPSNGTDIGLGLVTGGIGAILGGIVGIYVVKKVLK